MGLTIHYTVKSTAKTPERAKATVEKMRQLALDLPFEQVDSKVQYYGPEICQTPMEDLRGRGDLFGEVLSASERVAIPWHKKQRAATRAQPLEMFTFNVIPGPGSEWLTLGLARYPAEIDCQYSPECDDHFIKTIKQEGMTRWEFDWAKWRKWLIENQQDRWRSPDEFVETRKIKTRLSGWRYGTFCKTQYASEPDCGGVPNFIRCHVSLIHLLDRIGKLPTVKMGYNDEGKYGPSYYTDDWRVEKPVYTWHEGQYNVQALIQEIGEWNEMIAAQFGALQDMAKAHGAGIESPITGYSNFEQLEFKGQNQEHLAPFLQAMKQLAEQGMKE